MKIHCNLTWTVSLWGWFGNGSLYGGGSQNFKSSSLYRGKSSEFFQVPEHVWWLALRLRSLLCPRALYKAGARNFSKFKSICIREGSEFFQVPESKYIRRAWNFSKSQIILYHIFNIFLHQVPWTFSWRHREGSSQIFELG